MAMFLSRLKQILNLGTKSITANGTYSASGDGYDGYSQVSVNMPSITPSNSNPVTLTANNAVTPTASGKVVASIADVTPSNTSPVALTANGPVKPTSNGYAIGSYINLTPSFRPNDTFATDDIVRFRGNGVIVDSITSITPDNSDPPELIISKNYFSRVPGYAIAGYSNVTPSSTPESVASGDIVKIGGSGVIVDNVPPTPTSITPSNSSPVALTANTPVNPTANGYAIESYEEITPKNSNPPTLLLGHIYKIKTRNGIAIGAVNTVFPSDDDPPLLPVGSYNFVNGAPGYLYATKQKIKTGTVTLSTSATTYVNIGFKPKYIGLIVYKDNTHFNISIYNENISDSYTYRGAENTSSNMNCAAFALPTTSTTTNATKILSIDSTGFTIDKTTSTFGTMAKYFAIGEESTGNLPPMNVTVHHGSSSASNYAVVDNIGYTKLKLVSSTATTSAGNQYAIDNGSYTSVSVGSTVSIPSTGQVKLYLNRTGESTAVWQFSN